MQNNIGEARRSYAMTTPEGRFSQEDAANYFGVSVSAYQKWEQGTGKSLKVETLCDMADLYGVSVDYLLCRTDTPNFEPKRSLGRYETSMLEACSRLNAQQRELLLSTAENFAVANEKDGAGNQQDVGRVEVAVR